MTSDDIRSQLRWLNRERESHCEKIRQLSINIARSMDSVEGFVNGFRDENESVSGDLMANLKNEIHCSNGWMNTMREWIHYVEMVNEKMRWLEILLEDEEKGGDR